MACCTQKVVLENCINSQSDCGLLPVQVFDAFNGVAPKFSVLQVTNTGSCPIALFAIRTFDPATVLANFSALTLPLPTTPTALTALGAGFVDIIAPGATETITISDLQILAYACLASLVPAPVSLCSVTIKMTNTFCIASCGSGCSSCSSQCTEPVLVESCVNSQSACGAAPQSIFNAGMGVVPKFTVVTISNNGTCNLVPAITRSFDLTGGVSPLPVPLTGATVPPNSSLVLVVSDAILIAAACASTVGGTLCSFQAVVKAFFCVDSCNATEMEIELCKISFPSRKGGCSEPEERKKSGKSCSLSFL